ncbi:hypothetical protein AB4876_04965 [Zhongshania guokunii]|uniref:Patatin-like phospholipase family protein n=1 Tax=Zhongshania guokunii TaxID=641783 RepID=A0ABV3U361_9GAMM
MSLLRIRAGKSALEHIQSKGLSPSDISAVFGASGAAKWLAIYGLDRAIFSEWLVDAHQPINLFGTSVGAFKLAGACRQDSAKALDELAHAYIEQSYPNGFSADLIDIETQKLLDSVVDAAGLDEILSHPVFRYHCGTVLAKGWLAQSSVSQQKYAMALAFALNGFGRNIHTKIMQRVIFADARADGTLAGRDAYTSHRVVLNRDNLRAAITGSGSIPVVMHGVKDILGAPAGMHRDGGLLDYHPVPGNVWQGDGLVLYPHFYSEVTSGWFDKYFFWRKTPKALLDKVVLISPSESFLASTELGRIPDRRDFLRMQGDDPLRKRLWWDSAKRSLELGEAFLTLAKSGDIGSIVEPI